VIRPSGHGWKKVASVTPGGKPHFWYRRINGEREWWVWNRQTETWEYKSDKATITSLALSEGR